MQCWRAFVIAVALCTTGTLLQGCGSNKTPPHSSPDDDIVTTTALPTTTTITRLCTVPNTGFKSRANRQVSADASRTYYIIQNGQHSGQCAYCHGDGDTELYGCNRNEDDQKWYLEPAPAANAGGKANAYTLHSKKYGLCLATDTGHKVFGWSDCSTSDQGETSDRAWIISPASHDSNLMIIENAKFSGMCLASDDGYRFFLYSCSEDYKDQKWAFDPPLPTKKFDMTDPVGDWAVATSSNDDIQYSLTIGMSWTSETQVTQTDQVQVSAAFETEGEFLIAKDKVTVTPSYMHQWATMVSHSETKSVTSGCTATCNNLPAGSPGWRLYQWRLQAVRNEDRIQTETCNFLCMPQPLEPQCPPNCCSDQYCQCCDDCFAGNVVLSAANTTMIV